MEKRKRGAEQRKNSSPRMKRHALGLMFDEYINKRKQQYKQNLIPMCVYIYI